MNTFGLSPLHLGGFNWATETPLDVQHGVVSSFGDSLNVARLSSMQNISSLAFNNLRPLVTTLVLRV